MVEITLTELGANTKPGKDKPKAQEPSKEEEPVTDIACIVGSFGLWQKLILIVVAYVEVIAAISNLSSAILAPNVKYVCDSNASYQDAVKNYSEQNKLNWVIISNAGENCNIEANSGNNTISFPCTKWIFNHSVYKQTFTEELNLVCDNEWMINFSSSLALIGDLVACLVFGYLADRFGRKPTLLIMLVPAVSAPLVTLFAKTPWVFLLGRFLAGGSGYGALIVSFVLLMELVGVDNCGSIGMLVKFGWCTGGVYLGLMAYWLRESFNIQIAVSVPTVLLIPAIVCLPESPRWLLYNNPKNKPKAEAIIRKAAWWNRKKTDDIINKVDSLAAKISQEKLFLEKKYGYLDLFRTLNMAMKTLLLSWSWAVSLFLFYGITLNSWIFGDNPIISFIILCAIEFPSRVFFYITVQHFGSKVALLFSYIFTAVMCFCGAGIITGTGVTSIIFISLAKFAVTGCTDVTYIFTTEHYPTVIRSLGMGFCSLIGRVAALTTPYIADMSKATGLWSVFIFLGVLSLSCFAAVLFLPNMYNKPLLETLEAGERIGLINPITEIKEWITQRRSRKRTNESS